MIPILRRLSKSIPLVPSTPFSLSKLIVMDSSSSGSQRLVALAQQLRLYKPPPTFEDMEEQSLEESGGKVVSQVGFAESATPIAQQDPQRIRPMTKKAAVLVCLFEGDAGDLRVILTKRSSRLSTHSGQWAFFCLVSEKKKKKNCGKKRKFLSLFVFGFLFFN